jgi:hypothetical protein
LDGAVPIRLQNRLPVIAEEGEIECAVRSLAPQKHEPYDTRLSRARHARPTQSIAAVGDFQLTAELQEHEAAASDEARVQDRGRQDPPGVWSPTGKFRS